LQTPEQILKQYWGYDQFRPLQKEIVQSVLDQKDTVALLPTGGGKSICFQVPAMMMNGTCLVVTPLIALMKDQVEHLQSKKITAAYLHSGLSKREMNAALNNSLYGAYKFLYVSPERFRSAEFLKYLRGIDVCLMAVDEAHCISQWGFDFRPAYLELNQVRSLIGDNKPIVALTATATPKVVADIQSELGLNSPNLFSKSFSRENLNYLFIKDDNRRGRLLKALQKIPGTAIVYTRNRRTTTDLSKYLNSEGIVADHYHAGLDFELRSQKQNEWMKGNVRVMVATNAFGMGIDKSEVRQVIHFQIPDSIEAYYQEAGRAGRDGAESWCSLIFDSAEIENCKERLAAKHPDLEDVRRVYDALCNYYQMAFHSGLGRTFDFELLDFCGKFNLAPRLVHAALQLLNKMGLMKLSDGIDSASRLKLAMSQAQLYDYQLRNPEFDVLLKLLLRSYGGLFDHYIPIDEWEIGKRINLSKKAIRKSLISLAKANVLEYYPRKEKPFIQFLSNRVTEIDFSPSWIRDNPQRELERLTAMLRLVESEFCREKEMLLYFGQNAEEDCGRCDYCRKKSFKQGNSNRMSKIAGRLENLLNETPKSLENLVKHFDSTDELILADEIRKLLDLELIIKDENGLLFWNKK